MASGRSRSSRDAPPRAASLRSLGPPRSRPRRSGLPLGDRCGGRPRAQPLRTDGLGASARTSTATATAAASAASAAAAASGGRRAQRDDRFVFIVAGEPLEFLDGVDDLRDVEERVAFEADVNEGGLHAGENLVHPALVDVANDAALILALDEDFDDLVVLEDGDPRLVVARGDDHLLVHGNSGGVPPQGPRGGQCTSSVTAASAAASQTVNVSHK